MCISQGQNGVANHDRQVKTVKQRQVKTVKQVIITEGATTDYVRMNDKLAAGDWSKKKKKTTTTTKKQKKIKHKKKTKKKKQQTSDIEKLHDYQLLPQGFSLPQHMGKRLGTRLCFHIKLSALLHPNFTGQTFTD